MSEEIDDGLYSRQRYVLGDSAMLRLSKCSVFINGMGALGVETAKNVILAGVRAVTVHDSCNVSKADLGNNFFLRQEDVRDNGLNRAVVCRPRLAELNNYVTVTSSAAPLTTDTLDQLSHYQCVVLTDSSLALAKSVDAYCRSHSPPIMFVYGAIRGVFGQVFCDFGKEFEVVDYNDEEPVEEFIGNITKSNPGVVTCLPNHKHGLESGQWVTFREVIGMVNLNSTRQLVKVLSPEKFEIGDTSGFETYEHGGIFRQVKVPVKVMFQSLEEQVVKPAYIYPDYSKMEAPLQSHIAFRALDQFLHESGRLPKPWESEDSGRLVQFARDICSPDPDLANALNEDVVRDMACTSSGCFAPLAAALGGFLAQEVLKSVSGKFTPLQQWLYADTREVLPLPRLAPNTFVLQNDRYDSLRTCVGEEVLTKLANLRLFMVGCGAIGCEMLKNYAMLGVGSSSEGLITITDNDLIEKSNLNRQFLFRPHHIQKAKSTTAAAAAVEINPGLRIDAQLVKVGPKSEQAHYPDAFFQRQDLCVNALDNVEARRYMDGRCVSNGKPLMESGTLGAKGHVQVIVPNLTESYSSQQDPPMKEVPYCTLKSFPATIDHTIQWARDKFEATFTQSPRMYSNFWVEHGKVASLLQALQDGSPPANTLKAVHHLAKRPTTWQQVVEESRRKFEKLFNHAAKDLLDTFPIDTLMKDGSLFWQSPKRPPVAVEFDSGSPMHMLFIRSYASLRAAVCGIEVSENDLHPDLLLPIILSVDVPAFKPSGKRIETDESAKAPAADQEDDDDDDDAVEKAHRQLRDILAQRALTADELHMVPEMFEKDDDSNHHIDFITSASNLRASMYGIQQVDRFKTKRIAGRIVPAIATTTAAVAGLVAAELVKVVMGRPLESYRNAFLNLAIPAIILSEPAPPARTLIKEGVYTTIWDNWSVKGSASMTVQQFLTHVKASFGLEPTMVVHGVKMIYVPIMPGHKKRLPQPLRKFLKSGPEQEYVDLTVSFLNEKNEEVTAPPVRYFLG